MKYEKKDILSLLDRATKQERKELAELMDLDNGNNPKGKELTDHLWWKYQSPLGYMIRTPTFDEICLSVTEKFLKVASIEDYDSCWKLLDQLVLYLFEKIFDELDADKKEEFSKQMLNKEDFESLAGKMDSWEKIRGSLITSTGVAVKQKIIITGQLSRSLLGRSLPAISHTKLPILGPAGWFLIVLGINDLLGTNWKRVIPSTLYISCIYDRLKSEKKLPF